MAPRHTAFNAIHRKLGAKLVDFAGFEMPVSYTSIIAEHKAVRTAVGLFDVSHMGEFEVRGADALTLVQRVTTNDAAKLIPSRVQYSAMCYPDGGIVDDLLVYRFPDRFMFVVNASNIKKDFDWISSHTAGLQVELLDKSDDVSLLALQGPKSLDTLRKLTAVNLADMAYYTFAEANVGGVEMIVSRTGYTGELGFELYFDSSPVHAERAWNMLMEAGREFGITPAGLGARDSLRLEMGYCLYGNDIDQTTHPLEAGLSWITKLDKGDFVGRASLLEKQREGLRRKLVGFTTEDPRAIPRHGYEIHCGNASPGVVTSGTVSPTLERGIGMGYVPAGSAGAGSALEVLIRGRECMATVVKLPFIRK